LISPRGGEQPVSSSKEARTKGGSNPSPATFLRKGKRGDCPAELRARVRRKKGKRSSVVVEGGTAEGEEGSILPLDPNGKEKEN